MKLIKVVILFCLFMQATFAEPLQVQLPDPLDLDYALSLAKDESHPDIITARSMQELALSEVIRADSDLGLQIKLELEAAVIEPSPLALNQDRDDHIAVLRVTKSL